MANYNTLISAIQSVIAANGNNEITGNILQQTLLAMINALGGGYQFGGLRHRKPRPEPRMKKYFILGVRGHIPISARPSFRPEIWAYFITIQVGTLE